ncbi:hypothetical protein THOM_3250 [Trachipleistophora hominis]|uniref:Uncharacterized protein n=1 Tax=Trachipleistophora hominis TaxID=72359 RepID=L7JRG8_TRAHO|nr:hypothetical protein THOM_3250 [Trachipleistophora hominis]
MYIICMFILFINVLQCTNIVEQRISTLKTKLCKTVSNFHVDEEQMTYVKNCAQIRIARELLVGYQTECSVLKLNLWNIVNEWKNGVRLYVTEMASEIKSCVTKWKKECIDSVIRIVESSEQDKSIEDVKVTIKNEEIGDEKDVNYIIQEYDVENKETRRKQGDINENSTIQPDTSMYIHRNDKRYFKSWNTGIDRRSRDRDVINMMVAINRLFISDKDIDIAVNTYLERVYKNVYDPTVKLFNSSGLLHSRIINSVSEYIIKYFLTVNDKRTFIDKDITRLYDCINDKLKEYKQNYKKKMDITNVKVTNFIKLSLLELYKRYNIEINDYLERLNTLLEELFLRHKRQHIKKYEEVKLVFH